MDTKTIGGRILCYEDGQVIFEQDSTGSEVYIIESGKVEISQRINGKNITVSILGKGDLFGETAVFAEAPRSNTAVSLGRTTLISLTMEELIYRMQNNFQFASDLIEALISRLHNSNYNLSILVAKIYTFSGVLIEEIFLEKRSLKLGEILIEMDYLTKPQLERAIRRQKEIHIFEQDHKLLGEIIVELGFITNEQLRNALAEQKLRLRNRSE